MRAKEGPRHRFHDAPAVIGLFISGICARVTGISIWGFGTFAVSCLQQPPEFALGHNRTLGIAMIAAMMVRPSTYGDEAARC